MHRFPQLNLTTLLETAHIGIVIHRFDTSVVYANPTALELLRLSFDQIVGKDAFDPQWRFLDEAGHALLVEDFPVNKVLRHEQPLHNEIIAVMDSSSEQVTWVKVNAYFERFDNEDGYVVVIFNDISDSKKSFSFESIVENAQDVVIVSDAKNIDYPTGPRIVYVNKAFEKLTGYTREEAIGETPRILQGNLTDEKSKQRIRSALERKEEVSETLLNYDVRGRPYWIELNIIPLRNAYGDVTHFAAIERDVSEGRFQQEQLTKRNQDLRVLKDNLEHLVQERSLELQKAKSKLEKIAFLDPLTGIPNRRRFMEQVDGLIKGSRRRDELIAFGYMDIDDFKPLNDTHGHDAGDIVLTRMGDLLNHHFRGDDCFCRSGGEEFTFAVAIRADDDVESLASRLQSAINSMSIEIKHETRIGITVSMGLHIIGADQIEDPDDAIKHADAAMYEAKTSGKNSFRITYHGAQ